MTAIERPVRAQGRFFAVLAILVLATACVYAKGLHGVFLFDDFANLPSLGAFGPVDNWTAFTRYITSGIADPTGRPLALLTFLIDAHDWPADPFPFKRTNLIIHLLNGVLLALLLRRLGRIVLRGDTARSDTAAALGAGLWMLHPLFVSTTLYVVQREAMLPTTFALLGLLGYCRGRAAAQKGSKAGAWTAAASIVGCTILGVASKANGALLPLLAWIVDAVVLSRGELPATTRRTFTRARLLVLVLPSIALLAWLASQAMTFFLHGVSATRPWTIGERLLTEARIVCEYLHLLWLPRPYTAGLFNDAVEVSTNLLSPPTTLASIAFLTALLAVAIALRKRAPPISLAILFFFAGHLLESSVIPLELYYEHRNYLPAMPIFWPLAIWLTGRDQALARRTLAVVLLLLFGGMTFLRADLWGNAQDQALLWAEKNPQSPRAQAYAAAAERARGRPDLAAERTRRARVAATEDIQVALNLVGAQCEIGRVEPADLERARKALRDARTAGRLYFEWIEQAIARVGDGSACPGLGVDEISRLIDAVDENPNMRRYAGWRQDNLSLRGDLALARHDPQAALGFFNRALDEQVKAATALSQAARLGAAGYPDEGLQHLDHYRQRPEPPPRRSWSMAGLHAWLLYHQGMMQGEVDHLRGVLEEDRRNQSAPQTPAQG